MSRASLVYLGPYRLLNVVHTGHTCQIWQAYDDTKQQMVGIKTLIERCLQSGEHRRALRWEHRVAEAILHPRVLRIHNYAVDRGVPYLCMEWCPIPNIKQRMMLGIEPIAHLVPRIIEQAAEGLAVFNNRGWVHRDVKPDNFLVSDTGDVKLIDFALAVRARMGWLKWLSRRPKVQGTLSYISPEQLRGEVVDIRADVYSFGCTVHELISGRPPFTGTNPQDLLNKHIRATPPSLGASDKNVTPEFAQLVRRCLAKDRAIRPQSMEEFLRELRGMRVFKVPPVAPV